MISVALKKKLEKLSLAQQNKIEKEIDVWLKEESELKLVDNKTSVRGYGSLKDKIWMSDDFDESLESFKDYM
ncbi:DUF2281 domain-containing protein [Mucilaginibacter dorajii]|uniref:DUF2281 domain-containing protein n=1 Tax=Mucilaginibacter dorajii TaxID=692994 RepID=A0ABP7R3Y3_9SPHI|nr:DUF2281 domain-containing protein [Mucilaginibacter dorajii]MCS3737893.1 hypothetical protein [Mucilaginibacter dorajii]